MSRHGFDDPWARGNAPYGRGRGVLTVALMFAAICLSAYVGRLSVPPGSTQAIPKEAAGASRMNGDVPVGYARTRDGAVAAATNYSAVLAGPLILEPSRYRAAEAVIAAPSARSAVTAEGEQAIAAVDASTGAATEARRGVRVAVRYVPLAYRMTAYDAGRATVSIWGLWLVGVQGLLAPTETWSTRTFVLEWIGGDWKLTSSSTSPGPRPQPGQQAVSTAELPSQLTDFEEYVHASR